MRSTGFRFLVVGALTLLMMVPLFFAGSIVKERAFYAEQTTRDIGREWGGEQTLLGPFLVIPVEGTDYRTEVRETTDPFTGQTLRETFEEPFTVRRAPVILLPEGFDASIQTTSETRRRGIFEVPVYAADVGVTASFDPARAAGGLRDDERLLWGDAHLRLSLSSNAGLRGETTVTGPGGALDLNPYAEDRIGGVEGRVGALDKITSFDIAFRLNGSGRIAVVPVGRHSAVTMMGDWTAPGFSGTFLPDSHQIDDTGYRADWSVPHLARTLPQVSRDGPVARHAFGTSFVQENDFYQKAWRAARYGILFIALTFLTVLLTERKDRPTHPVQYILIGVAQSLFVLLMVAYAERIGFAAAYAGAAGATTLLLTLFGLIGLKLGRRTFVLAGLLTLLYAVLYLILQATDLALLAGATLAFGALALTMIATRNEAWSGDGAPRPGPWARLRGQKPSPASAASGESSL